MFVSINYMYQKNDLYKVYKKYVKNDRLSDRLPDVGKKYTLDIINKAINSCENWNNFLDIGACGGHYSIALLHKFKNGVAVEATPNEQLLGLAKEYKNLTVKTGFIQKINFTEKFDFVLMADVFEHIPLVDMGEFTKKISTIQDVGGVIYILTPNPLFCGPASTSGMFHNGGKFDHEGHYKHYLPNEILSHFKKFNYEMVFDSYEEGILKNILKRYIFSLSIRDRRYSNNKIYRIISLIPVYLIKIAFMIMGRIIYWNEWKNRKNDFNSMSYVVVLKKTK